MMPISGVNTVAVQPLTTAEKVLGASKVQKPEEEAQGRQLKVYKLPMPVNPLYMDQASCDTIDIDENGVISGLF